MAKQRYRPWRVTQELAWRVQALADNGVPQRAIARELRLARDTVAEIVHGSYDHVDWCAKADKLHGPVKLGLCPKCRREGFLHPRDGICMACRARARQNARRLLNADRCPCCGAEAYLAPESGMCPRCTALAKRADGPQDPAGVKEAPLIAGPFGPVLGLNLPKDDGTQRRYRQARKRARARLKDGCHFAPDLDSIDPDAPDPADPDALDPADPDEPDPTDTDAPGDAAGDLL